MLNFVFALLDLIAGFSPEDQTPPPFADHSSRRLAEANRASVGRAGFSVVPCQARFTRVLASPFADGFR